MTVIEWWEKYYQEKRILDELPTEVPSVILGAYEESKRG